MSFELRKFNKNIAEDILLYHNDGNRSIKKHTVDMYARDMASGKWEENGQPIVFGKDGNLKDGQHRLSAIIKSDVEIELPVFIAENDVHTFDVGAKRSYSDIVRMKGSYAPNRTTMQYVAQIRTLCTILKGIGKPSISDVEDFIDKYGSYADEAYFEVVSRQTRCRTSAFMSACTTMKMLGYETEKFVNIVQTGFYENENQTSAVVLRNQILEGQFTQKSASGVKLLFRVVCKAIDDFNSEKQRHRQYPRDLDKYTDEYEEKWRTKYE